MLLVGHQTTTTSSVDVEAQNCVQCGASHFHSFVQVKRSTLFFIPVDVQWVRANLVCSQCEEVTQNDQLTEELRQHVIQNAPDLEQKFKQIAKPKQPVHPLYKIAVFVTVLLVLVGMSEGEIFNFLVYLVTGSLPT